jgi:hypothetical protein
MDDRDLRAHGFGYGAGHSFTLVGMPLQMLNTGASGDAAVSAILMARTTSLTWMKSRVCRPSP